MQADVPIRGRVPRTCSLPDCGEPYFAKDLCRLHYSRLRKTGTSDAPPQYGDTCTADGCDGAHFVKGYCKRCYAKLKSRQWRKEHPDYSHERGSSLRTCTTEGCDRPYLAKGLCARCYMRIKSQQWRDEHPGYDAESKSAWRAANIEESRRQAREYAKRHPETKRAVEARRQERLRRTEGERIDYEKVLAEHGMVCHICWWDITSRADLHMDHVIPLARGGTHTYDNIKPAHAGCNRWKHARLMSEL